MKVHYICASCPQRPEYLIGTDLELELLMVIMETTTRVSARSAGAFKLCVISSDLKDLFSVVSYRKPSPRKNDEKLTAEFT